MPIELFQLDASVERFNCLSSAQWLRGRTKLPPASNAKNRLRTDGAALHKLDPGERSDLDIVRKDVKEEGFAISIVRDGRMIFQSALPGISALVAAIDKNRFGFRGATAGDRVLGRAAAMLYLYSGISSVFASTASSDATAILSKFGVPFEYETKVPMILNRQRTAICPFESSVQEVETPEEAFKKLKALSLKPK